MKRILRLLLIISIFCFAGCSEEATVDTEPGTKYTLIRIQMEDAAPMDEEALKQHSNGEDFYIRLYDDGTAKLHIQPGDPVDMRYDEKNLWQAADPDTKASYEIVDGIMTVVDYPFEYTFRKQ